MTPEQRLAAELRANDAAQTTAHHAVELIAMGVDPERWWPYLAESLEGRDREGLLVLYGVAVSLAAKFLESEYGSELGLRVPQPALAAEIRQDLNDTIDQL